MNLVKSIGKGKMSQGIPIYRPEREQAIIERLVRQNRGLLNSVAISAIFHEIFAVSRNLELPERIAYLGPEGSFTHQAAEMKFGPTSEYLELANIRAVFDAVHTGRVRYGVVPIENNQQGSVHETILLLGEKPVKIVSELTMPIHFSFASRFHDLQTIEKVYSKDIAFRQCERFLADTFGDLKVECIPVESTSKAAKLAMTESASAAKEK
jgi:chorismate mutase/prephenate dehydratase